MKRILLGIFCINSLFVAAQSQDFKKAPNSYIYDIDLAKTNNYGGILIPVRKAYENWANYTYLKTNGVSTPIPAGTLTASLYWEDLPGLISNVSIQPAANPQDSKIKVEINEARGKGNAVIAFKVDGTIYWTWHVWVTDNPENGVVYKHGYETNVDMVAIEGKYMDRNLGAVNKNFVGNNWDKSGGLMYQWGRKDPFPALVNKDAYFYELNGEVGVLKHKSIDPVNTIPVVQRPFNEIEKNIQYSVNNPINYIINTDATGNWFSNQRYKVAGTNTIDYASWDLWADNAKGNHSNANSSSTVLKNESRSYELKSELDPCPNGWRVPSYYGRVTQNNNLSPWGRNNNWNNDDPTDNAKLLPNTMNPVLNGIKVYPGRGMDFTNAQNGGRNLGIMPISGAYVYYPNSAAPNAPVGVVFQDNNANGGLWSATFGYDGARLFSLISDAYRTNTTVGLHAIFINQTNPTRSGNAVRCLKDPNMSKIGNFTTEYFQRPKENYDTGLGNPNSYIVTGNVIEIPVNKAFSVYNQILTDHQSLKVRKLVAKVLWTTNEAMITKLEMAEDPNDQRNSSIVVSVAPQYKGNAVISLHDTDTKNDALWSWHIWNTEGDPDTSLIYTTENVTPTAYNFVAPTKSGISPITTKFMDRNLGAINSIQEVESNGIIPTKSFGLHYQWGRKDPMPSFATDQHIFLGSDNTTANNILTYTKLFASEYLAYYTQNYQNYGSNVGSKHEKVRTNIAYSVKNPLTFLYQSGLGDIYNGGTHVNNLTKLRDWVLNERNQAAERWGHAAQKSPFDPCPSGWRVPDVSYTNLYSGSKGNSPWYNGYNNDAYGNPGVIQDQWHPITTFYQGTAAGNYGWKFNGANYKIGSYPMDGTRGELGENQIGYNHSGVWTASLADLATGFALAMQFEKNTGKMQTGTGVYPQAAMGVRCSRDEFPQANAAKDSGIRMMNTAAKIDPKLAASEPQLQIFPSPFTNEINVGSPEADFFELYDMGGKLVLAGRIENGKISPRNLTAGMFTLKIVFRNGTSATKKVLKK